MRNENKETNQGKKAIGESMGSRIVLALIVVAGVVTAGKREPFVRHSYGGKSDPFGPESGTDFPISGDRAGRSAGNGTGELK